MWDDPTAINRLSGLLLMVALVSAVWVVGSRMVDAWLPIAAVEVRGAGHEETRLGVRPVLARLSGGLFSVDLEAAQQGFEALPWVRAATVRRLWPDSLVVELEEHVPAAAWNGTAMLNVQGEVFPVRPWPGLPGFHAPEGMEKEVTGRYATFARVLGEHGPRIAMIRVDARRAWQLALTDGVFVDLGRERLDERMRRFVTFYPMVLARVVGARRIDMRYPNGFAVQGEVRT